MGFLSGLFGGSGDDTETSDGGGDATPTCDVCGRGANESELSWGQCEDCASDFSGPRYCCGAIYEDGEETCASCGESL